VEIQETVLRKIKSNFLQKEIGYQREVPCKKSAATRMSLISMSKKKLNSVESDGKSYVTGWYTKYLSDSWRWYFEERANYHPLA